MTRMILNLAFAAGLFMAGGLNASAEVVNDTIINGKKYRLVEECDMHQAKKAGKECKEAKQECKDAKHECKEAKHECAEGKQGCAEEKHDCAKMKNAEKHERDCCKQNANAVAADDSQPQFPGGMPSLKRFVKTNLKYPTGAFEFRNDAKVMVEFTVNEDGSISNAKTVSPKDELLDAEALRLVASMPKWTPAMKDGKPVKSQFKMPLAWSLGDDADLTNTRYTETVTVEERVDGKLVSKKTYNGKAK